MSIQVKDANGDIQTIETLADLAADGGNVTFGAKADAAWNGSDAAPTGMSIWKYIGLKLEAVRALLAGAISVTDGGTSFATVWGVSGVPVQSADITAGVLVTDVPTTGQHIVPDDILLSVGADNNITLKEETSGTVLFGPWYCAAKSGPIQITLRGKKKVPTANRRIVAFGSAAGTVSIQIGYHSEA